MFTEPRRGPELLTDSGQHPVALSRTVSVVMTEVGIRGRSNRLLMDVGIRLREREELRGFEASCLRKVGKVTSVFDVSYSG